MNTSKHKVVGDVSNIGQLSLQALRNLGASTTPLATISHAFNHFGLVCMPQSVHIKPFNSRFITNFVKI